MVAALLTHALGKLAIDIGASAAVFNYGDAFEFSELWAASENGLPSILTTVANKESVIIVWQDVPTIEKTPAEGLLKPHLTPLDWALAFSNVVIESRKDVPVLDLRIHIIDLTGKKYEAAWSIRMRHQLLTEMPWITLHAPLMPIDDPAPYREKYHAILEGTGPEPALLSKSDLRWQFRSEGPPMSDSVRRGWGRSLDWLASQWAGSLTQSLDHHDVNNVIGAYILAKPKRTRENLFDAFLTRLNWIGYDLDAPVQQSRGVGTSPETVTKTATHISANSCWFDSESLADNLGRTVRFVLIDDQCNNGWKEVVAASLGILSAESIPLANPEEIRLLAAQGPVELWASTSALPLIDKLSSALIKSHQGDLRFSLRLTEGNEPDKDVLEVLLLDLRLSSARADEVGFFSEVVKLAIELIDRGPAWPWQPLPSITDMKDLLKRYDSIIARRTNDYFTLLTLLPRVIAAMDLTFPIVVFSSTGQRVVAENLKGHENIITAFEKPRFFGYRSEDACEHARAGFMLAMEQASTILRARSDIQRICRKSSMPFVRSIGCDRAVMELYLDESGSEFDESPRMDGGLTVGGLFIAGQIDDIEEFNSIVNPLVIGMMESGDATGVGFKQHLKDNVSQLAGHIIDAANRANIYASIVRLKGQLPERTDELAQRGSVENFRVGDNLGRELVGALTEAAVYHLGQAICRDAAHSEYRVYIGTRVLPIDSGREVLAEKLSTNWGLAKRFVDIGRYVWNAIAEIDDFLRDRSSDRELMGIRSALESYAVREHLKRKQVIQLLDDSGARPIVQGISRQYGEDASFQPLPEHARAYLLNSRLRATRPLHYSADALISSAALARTDPALVRLRANGFHGEFDSELRMILQGARLAANRLVGEGLANAARAFGASAADKNDLRRRLLTTLSSSAVQMSGSEFVRMVDALRDKRRAKLGTPIDRRRTRLGTVYEISGREYFLKLTPQQIKMKCFKTVGRGARISRGDEVEIEIQGEMTSWGAEDVIVKIAPVAPHADWSKIVKGAQVSGEVRGTGFFRGEQGRFVRLSNIEGFVPFRLASAWNKNVPAEREYRDLIVDEIDVHHRHLILRPKNVKHLV